MGRMRLILGRLMLPLRVFRLLPPGVCSLPFITHNYPCYLSHEARVVGVAHL